MIYREKFRNIPFRGSCALRVARRAARIGIVDELE